MAHRNWDVLIVAHRGIVSGFPENTLAACREAIRRGFSAIEVDLRATADGHIVVMHDETVDRTTNGCGEVSELTLADVRSLDAGSYVSPESQIRRSRRSRRSWRLPAGPGPRLSSTSSRARSWTTSALSS